MPQYCKMIFMSSNRQGISEKKQLKQKLQRTGTKKAMTEIYLNENQIKATKPALADELFEIM